VYINCYLILPTYVLHVWAVRFSCHQVEILVHKTSDTGETAPCKQWV